MHARTITGRRLAASLAAFGAAALLSASGVAAQTVLKASHQFPGGKGGPARRDGPDSRA